MAYYLFIALNAALFLRPQELIPGLEWANFYEWTIIACILTTGLAMLRQLSPDFLRERPINACVLGLMIAVPLSHLSHLSGESFWYARETLIGEQGFSKVALMFLLASAVLVDAQHIEKFFNWLLLLIAIVAGLSVGHHLGYFNIPVLESLQRNEFTAEGEQIVQLRGTGIFNDPNDLAMILVLGFVLSIHVLTDPGRGMLRYSALPLLGLLLLGLFLTKSRGGMLAFAAAVGVLAYTRWGKWRAMLVCLAASPLVLLVFKMRGGGGMEEGTGQGRIQFWAEGLALLRNAPLFGIGHGRLVEEVGHVAHNSYIHTFTELGLFGGMCFFGAFFAGLVALYRLRGRKIRDTLPPDSQRRLATLAAALVGYGVSMLSLSRAYVAPTYLVLGLAAAAIAVEVQQVEADPWTLPRLPRTDLSFAKQLVPASIAFLALMYVFVHCSVRWG